MIVELKKNGHLEIVLSPTDKIEEFFLEAMSANAAKGSMVRLINNTQAELPSFILGVSE